MLRACCPWPGWPIEPDAGRGALRRAVCAAGQAIPHGGQAVRCARPGRTRRATADGSRGPVARLGPRTRRRHRGRANARRGGGAHRHPFLLEHLRRSTISRGPIALGEGPVRSSQRIVMQPLLRLAVQLALVVSAAFLPAGCRTGSSQPSQQPSQAPTSSQPTNAKPQEQRPLRQLDAEFRPIYDQARDALACDLDPLVVSRFSDLYLFRGGKLVDQKKGIPQRYHDLRKAAHVPFALYLLLSPFAGETIPDAVRKRAEDYGARAKAAISDLGNYNFKPEEVAAQTDLLEASSQFTANLTAGQKLDGQQLKQYLDGIRVPMMLLADAAGAAQVDATHGAMSAWRQRLTDEEWARLRVMIVGPRQPRDGNAATRYFAALLGGERNTLFEGESERVFYVEVTKINRDDYAFAEELKVLRALILDRAASRMIFDDAYRMSIDVMTDGARRRVEQLDLTAFR